MNKLEVFKLHVDHGCHDVDDIGATGDSPMGLHAQMKLD